MRLANLLDPFVFALRLISIACLSSYGLQPVAWSIVFPFLDSSIGAYCSISSPRSLFRRFSKLFHVRISGVHTPETIVSRFPDTLGIELCEHHIDKIFLGKTLQE